MAKRSIKSVGLVVKSDRPRAVAIARELSGWLRSRRVAVAAQSDVARELKAKALALPELARRVDLIVVLGGDGTLLRIARMVGARETPILGVNLGALGFLTEVHSDEAQAALERVLAGDYEVDRRITLESAVSRDGKPRRAGVQRALNDVVINKRGLGRMLDLEVTADRKPFCAYRSDGLIVATPTGSTAYALSAGGPIVFPTLDVMVLAPICPHTLSDRPVVLPDSFELEVRILTKDHDAMLTLDGQESTQLGAEDTVHIRKGKSAVVLVRSAHPYFEIWRDKLRWG
ncbi:MAG: NAD(+)/NADH kinase [Candidatus Binataceae bacterium]